MRKTMPEGVIRVSVELRVDADEMKHWPTQCINAFFDGIARAQEATNFARESIAAGSK